MSTKVLFYKPTNEQLLKRRQTLLSIQENHNNSKKPVTKTAIRDEMRAKSGYPDYSFDMLRVDEMHIKSTNTFVSDLAMYTYSSTIQGMFEDLDHVRDTAMKDFEHEKGFVRINSKKLVVDTVLAKEKILSGRTLDVSIELLGKKLRQITAQKNDYEAELNKLKSELPDKS